MSGAGTGGATSESLDRLAERVVRLAEALEAAEVEIAAIRHQCEEVGILDRFAGHLDRLALPSDVAEHLQDELDQLSGELADEARPRRDRPARPPLGGDPHPVPEHLSVQCPSCGAHVALPAPGQRPGEGDDLDDRTYRCPRCGHEDRFETWDHFLEEDEPSG